MPMASACSLNRRARAPSCRVTQAALRAYAARAACGRVVVFDTETTGLSPSDEIVQLAAAEYVDGARARTFAAYVAPTCEIRPEAAAVHHLTRPFLLAHGVPAAEALAGFFDLLGRDALLVGHNVLFDLRMLRGACRRTGFAADPGELALCDTVALAKRLVPGLSCYRLGFLLEALGLPGANSHDALDDALACGGLFFDLVRRIPAAPGDYVYEPVFED